MQEPLQQLCPDAQQLPPHLTEQLVELSPPETLPTQAAAPACAAASQLQGLSPEQVNFWPPTWYQQLQSPLLLQLTHDWRVAPPEHTLFSVVHWARPVVGESRISAAPTTPATIVRPHLAGSTKGADRQARRKCMKRGRSAGNGRGACGFWHIGSARGGERLHLRSGAQFECCNSGSTVLPQCSAEAFRRNRGATPSDPLCLRHLPQRGRTLARHRLSLPT